VTTSPKLTDTQLVMLSGATQHPERALVMPERLRGGAVLRVVGPLLAKGLVEAVPHRADLQVYKTEADGSRTTLVITDAGPQALGIGPEPTATVEAVLEESEPAAPESSSPEAALRLRQPRTGTKQEMLIGMLRRPEGATVPEVIKATGWLPHTVRGAIAGALKKRLGLQITSERVEGRGRVYRIEGRAAAPLPA